MQGQTCVSALIWIFGNLNQCTERGAHTGAPPHFKFSNASSPLDKRTGCQESCCLIIKIYVGIYIIVCSVCIEINGVAA